MEQKKRSAGWVQIAISYAEEICSRLVDALLENPVDIFETLSSVLLDDNFINMCDKHDFELSWVADVDVSEFNFENADEIVVIINNLLESDPDELINRFFLYGYTLCNFHHDLFSAGKHTPENILIGNGMILMQCLTSETIFDECNDNI